VGAAEPIRIVVLGDSLAAGMGLAEADAFPTVAQTLLREAGYPVEVINAGVSGDTTAGGLSRLDWLLGQRPDILVVELGGNDALRGQPLENTEGNLREIIRRGREAGARVLLLGMDVPSNYGPEYGEAFAEMYRRVALDKDVPLVPGFVRELGGDPTLLQPDGLHPTAEGQRRLASKLLPSLEAILRDAGSHADEG
jgi:acyl-CoA thioesterase-1